jgi:ATP-dependent RNA helicase DDX10/DBP4
MYGRRVLLAEFSVNGERIKMDIRLTSMLSLTVSTTQHIPHRLLLSTNATPYAYSVLDEADRILDMGFSRTLSALLSHLPKSHQTLLFSATQTDSVNDLAHVSLTDPVHIGIGDTGSSTSSATPQTSSTTTSPARSTKNSPFSWASSRRTCSPKP